MPDLVEISRDEVVEKARAWAKWFVEVPDAACFDAEAGLLSAVTLLESREAEKQKLEAKAEICGECGGRDGHTSPFCSKVGSF